MKMKISASGPSKGPLLFFIIAALACMASPSATAAIPYSNVAVLALSGLDNFLVDLCANHRLLYAVLVTVGTALLGFILSLVMGWLLRLLHIDRLR